MSMLHFQNHFPILETVFPTSCYAFLHYAHTFYVFILLPIVLLLADLNLKFSINEFKLS